MDFEEPMEDSPLCIVCGWRRPAVPPEIQQEVKAYLGKNTNRSRYIRKRIVGRITLGQPLKCVVQHVV